MLPAPLATAAYVCILVLSLTTLFVSLASAVSRATSSSFAAKLKKTMSWHLLLCSVELVPLEPSRKQQIGVDQPDYNKELANINGLCIFAPHEGLKDARIEISHTVIPIIVVDVRAV